MLAGNIFRRADRARRRTPRPHKDLEHSLRYARVSRRAAFEGQQVAPENALADRDGVEPDVEPVVSGDADEMPL